MQDKEIAWTVKRFSGDSFPMKQEEKTFIPYINNVSNTDIFLKLSVKSFKF